MIAMQAQVPTDLAELLTCGVLTLCRVGGVIAFAPPFRGPGIPMPAKVTFALALTCLATPVVLASHKTRLDLTAMSVATEALLGLLLGLALSFLAESLLFAGALMSVSFSFSLANLLDPNSQVETDVLSALLNWLGVLVLLAAGLHRVVLKAVLQSFHALPLGSVHFSGDAGLALVQAGGGLFFAGLQLAAPVLAAALLVEVAIALVGRLAPGLPVQMLNVPTKTVVAYLTLVASIALWPGWIERHFTSLLDMAERIVRT